MNTIFSSLYTARSGLNLSQNAFNVIGKNIANVNTPGYTRQRVMATPAPNDLGVIFLGVEQIRDAFLDSHFRNEASALGEWSVKSEALQSIEDYLQEPSSNGLSAALTEFFASAAQVALQPEAGEMRLQMRQNAVVLCDNIKYIYNKLVTIQGEYDFSVSVLAGKVNDLADTIAELNRDIFIAENSGERANELRDRRNVALDELSKIVGFSMSEEANGMVNITIGGELLVSGTTVREIAAVKTAPNPIPGEGPLNSIGWADTGEAVEIQGGELKGYLDIIHGKGDLPEDDPKFLGIPYFIDKLNLFAKVLAEEVNAIHSTGYTLPGVSGVSKTGIDFFAAEGGGEITAKNITLSYEILSDVNNIAASGEEVGAANSGNNDCIKEIAKLIDRTDITAEKDGEPVAIGSLSGFFKGIVLDLAITSAHSTKVRDSEESILENLNMRRASISGVSLDEEMLDMIRYQHSYSAAARVMRALDSMLETLITWLGN